MVRRSCSQVDHSWQWTQLNRNRLTHHRERWLQQVMDDQVWVVKWFQIHLNSRNLASLIINHSNLWVWFPQQSPRKKCFKKREKSLWLTCNRQKKWPICQWMKQWWVTMISTSIMANPQHLSEESVVPRHYEIITQTKAGSLWEVCRDLRRPLVEKSTAVAK